MSNIPSVAQYIQIEGVRLRSPVSESVAQAMGGSINDLLDRATALEAEDVTQDARLTALKAAQVKTQNASFTASSTTQTITTSLSTVNLITLFFTATATGSVPITLTAVKGSVAVNSGFTPNTVTLVVTGSTQFTATGLVIGQVFYWTAVGAA